MNLYIHASVDLYMFIPLLRVLVIAVTHQIKRHLDLRTYINTHIDKHKNTHVHIHNCTHTPIHTRVYTHTQIRIYLFNVCIKCEENEEVYTPNITGFTTAIYVSLPYYRSNVQIHLDI